MKSKAKHFLSHNHTFASAAARVAGVFTSLFRERNVVMFHCGRCGSSVVGGLLNQHTKVRWAGEIFENVGYKYGEESWVWEKPLDMVYVRANLNYSRIYGFEFKKRHLKDLNLKLKQVVNKLRSLGYKNFIILKRKNYLDQDISRLVGKKIGKWNTKKSIDAPIVEVPMKNGAGSEILKDFEERDKFYEELKTSIPSDMLLELTYEKDIKESPKLAYQKTLKFLGVGIEDVEVETKKINKRQTKEKISNYDEVRGVLSGTDYEWMIE